MRGTKITSQNPLAEEVFKNLIRLIGKAKADRDTKYLAKVFGSAFYKKRRKKSQEKINGKK